jgi:hypothetical protein
VEKQARSPHRAESKEIGVRTAIWLTVLLALNMPPQESHDRSIRSLIRQAPYRLTPVRRPVKIPVSTFVRE